LGVRGEQQLLFEQEQIAVQIQYLFLETLHVLVERAKFGALRGGRIPGAVNVPYEANWLDPDTPRKLQRKQVDNKDGMALKPRDALRELYAALDPDKETIVYCQSGSRAAESATVLQDLGFKDVKIYDGSWLAWGNTFDAPVENVSYFNVGRVNGLLNQLQGRIDALEAEIEQLKSAARKQ